MKEKDFRVSLLKYLDKNNAHINPIDVGSFIFKRAGNFQQSSVFFNHMIKEEMIMGTLQGGNTLTPDMNWVFSEDMPEINIVITREGEKYLNDYKNSQIYLWTLVFAVIGVIIGAISLLK